ncbi:hypothetical protein [Halomarina litorea]|uniref:hypothetical protein n=1 Tax=Halomarina litorea TaxID=2961595 RepID=UPI0020C4B372|nr:hypothetical protein [Halomarina sp. BCD28]
MDRDTNVTTEEAFHRRLRKLVNDARANGVHVEGGWPIVSDDRADPSWDLEIVAVDRDD